MEVIVGPLQEKMDDWKKSAVALDKDHAKGNLIVFLFCQGAGNKLCTAITLNNVK